MFLIVCVIRNSVSQSPEIKKQTCFAQFGAPLEVQEICFRSLASA